MQQIIGKTRYLSTIAQPCLLSSLAKAIIILIAVEMAPGDELRRVELIKNAVTGL
jgi:hypothetical protein